MCRDKLSLTMLCLVRHGLTVTIDHEGDVPVYVQLASILRARIESGELAPRRAVPSKRTLMQEFGVAGGTVDKAIGILRAAGLVRTVTGRGIYVVPPAERRA
jgi:GntR family transcriptional regulator